MICQPCKDGKHCGRDNCTCQHRTTKRDDSGKPQPVKS